MENILTIIIPGYNVEKFITKILNNVFQQDSSDFEVIYVDDASCDKTLDVIKARFQSYIDNKRLRLLELHDNGGPATARQEALEKVTTPFVTFMDADDSYISSHVISKLIERLKADNPDLLMFKYITDHGKMKLKKSCSLPSSMSSKEAMIFKLKTGNPIWHYLWNKCYKVSVLLDNQIQFEKGTRSAEDVVFNRKYLKVAKDVKFLDEYFYVYNCTNNSSLTKQKTTLSEADLLLWWKREKTQYELLLNDCRDMNCETVCQPYLAQSLADTAVRLKALSTNMGGQIWDDVIKKDSLYPLLKGYLWKSRICYCSNNIKVKLKHVIKKLL